MAEHILLIAALAAARVLYLLAVPFGSCWWCRGTGRRIVKGGRRARKCWRCKGKGRVQHVGSRTVHRIRHQVVSHWRGPR